MERTKCLSDFSPCCFGRLAIVIWSIIVDEQRKENVLKSVDIAKQALMLDLKDGQSWYLVGNAWLINFFVNYKKIAELETAIKAYNEAVFIL